MTKTINGDLILTEDTTFIESIVVKGDIKSCYDLKVIGNIDAWNIDAWNIIFCNKIKVKKSCNVICKQLITDRFNLKRREWKV